MKAKRPNHSADQHSFDWLTPQPAPTNPPETPPAVEPRGIVPGDYPPGHPWHYYHEGDNLPPVPVDAIPASTGAGRFMERDLPKNPDKREAALRKLLDETRRQLVADKARYQDIATRGADALSDYDRNISSGGNLDLARAEALALKYNHVTIGLGRIAWLEDELLHYTPTML